MKTIGIGDLTPEGIEVRCHSAMTYKPKILRNTVIGRRSSSFLYISTGDYRYRSDGGELTAGAGDILYLPCGASYTYEIRSEEPLCMQFEFDLIDTADGEIVALSDAPTLAIEGDAHLDLADTFAGIVADILSDSHALRRTGSILLLLSEYADHARGSRASVGMRRIMPAVEYIRNHFTKRMCVAHLAALCYMSETQFRRLFKAETGVCAIDYKNRCMIRAAKRMLLCGEGSVGEIADGLGFPSIYTFSRTFKKYVGLSPTEYVAGARRNDTAAVRTIEKGEG